MCGGDGEEETGGGAKGGTRVRCDISAAKAKEVVEKLMSGLLRASSREGMRKQVVVEMNAL